MGINELETRLAEANDAAAKGGRNAMAKLEGRIREMEIELGGVQSKTSESFKSYQMSELANKLQAKIKTYKKQIEEAEEIAALNLAKFRKAQQGLEEAEDREKMAGTQLSMTHVGSVL